jgi:dephospho-CoA kinase
VIKVGLTGGIGSGKSTVARIFELLEVPVYYADQASKRLYETDAALMKSMRENFGDEIYSGDSIDRARLAAIVFADPEKLNLLNRLVHPPTIRDAENWMQQQTTPYVIKEAALLFESGSVAGLDYVIGIRAPLALRMKRVMDRDHVSREQVMARMQRQIDEAIKLRLCDFVIDNDEQQLVIPQVLALHQKLIELSFEPQRHNDKK